MEWPSVVWAKQWTGTAVLALTVLAVTACVLVCGGCGGGPPEIRVRYAGNDGGDFRIVNATDQTWSAVQVQLRRLRPDGIEAECAARQISEWQPAATQSFPACGGERTLLTIETAGQQAFFVLAEGRLYQKFGRREIPVR